MNPNIFRLVLNVFFLVVVTNKNHRYLNKYQRFAQTKTYLHSIFRTRNYQSLPLQQLLSFRLFNVSTIAICVNDDENVRTHSV